MKKNNHALQTVLLRNDFYRDSYHRARFGLLLAVLLNLALMGGIYYKFTNPPHPQYFAISNDGHLIQMQPLSDPVVTDDYVLQWVSDSVRKAFNLDFLHWQQQLQDASAKFTPAGWQNFLDALKASNNLETLTKLQMVSDLQVTAAPKILRKMVVDGRYAWNIQMPVLLTYSNGQRSIPMPMNIMLIVMRVPVTDNPDQVAINNFLPVIDKTSAGPLP